MTAAPTTILSALGVGKSFSNREVLCNVSCTVSAGQVLAIVGPNGSGKSTLMRILAGVLRPDAGTISCIVNGSDVPRTDHYQHVGLVAPYLNIYDEFTAAELLHLQMRLRQRRSAAEVHTDSIEATLASVGLTSRMHDPIRSLSSGLRQRILVAQAIHHRPAVLLLDEPTVTLDEAGRELVRHHVEAHAQRGGVVCIATNDERERSWCTTEYSVY